MNQAPQVALAVLKEVGILAEASLPPAQADIAGNRIVPARLCLRVLQLVTVAPGFIERFLRKVFSSLGAAGQLNTEADKS